MSLFLTGLGWVTPLGGTINEVWEKLLRAEEAAPTSLTCSTSADSATVFAVPPEAISQEARFPRLRRSSVISRFAVAAGLSALRQAGVELDEKSAQSTALIFAISDGGVIYTRRFYHEIVESGASAASPLLFPETVFNAPASHLAAILGLTGATYTLVGDAAVGILALQMAEDLLANPELERVLVVGAEEADWLLCDAYRKWRLVRSAPPIEPFANLPRGTILSEGAGALLVARRGNIELENIQAGRNFSTQRDAGRGLEITCEKLPAPSDVWIASANGTFIDRAEENLRKNLFAEASIYSAKPALGESISAGSIWQVIAAAMALQRQELPPTLHSEADTGATTSRGSHRWQRAAVTACGLNGQLAALTLRVTK